MEKTQLILKYSYSAMPMPVGYDISIYSDGKVVIEHKGMATLDAKQNPEEKSIPLDTIGDILTKLDSIDFLAIEKGLSTLCVFDGWKDSLTFVRDGETKTISRSNDIGTSEYDDAINYLKEAVS